MRSGIVAKESSRALIHTFLFSANNWREQDGTGSCEAAVLAGSPFVFWKLTETNDPSVGGVVAYDYVRGD